MSKEEIAAQIRANVFFLVAGKPAYFYIVFAEEKIVELRWLDSDSIYEEDGKFIQKWKNIPNIEIPAANIFKIEADPRWVNHHAEEQKTQSSSMAD